MIMFRETNTYVDEKTQHLTKKTPISRKNAKFNDLRRKNDKKLPRNRTIFEKKFFF